MTFEKVVFIKPEDIISVQFRCITCDAAITIPIKKLANTKAAITQGCGYCQTPSGFNAGTEETAKLEDFNALLGELEGILKGRNLAYSIQVNSGE
jgi:hypothetical protein